MQRHRDINVSARGPDIVKVDKENKACYVIDVAISGYDRILIRQKEKIDKCQNLVREIRSL